MGAIVCTENSRQSATMRTAYTLPLVLDSLGDPVSAGSVNVPIYADPPVLLVGMSDITGPDQAWGSHAAFLELGATSATALEYGSGLLDGAPRPFGVWDGKAFGAGATFTPDNYSYVYVDFPPASGAPGVTSIDQAKPAHFDATSSAQVPYPLSWTGLSHAVCVLSPQVVGTGVVRAEVVHSTGQAFLDPICTIEQITNNWTIAAVMPDPANGRNWFLCFASWMSTWLLVSASNSTGINITSDTVTFASADVQAMLAQNYNVATNIQVLDGQWLLSFDRADWTASLGISVVQGHVIVRVARDCSTYDVLFLGPQTGDTTAEAFLGTAHAYTNHALAKPDGSIFVIGYDGTTVNPVLVLAGSGGMPDPMPQLFVT